MENVLYYFYDAEKSISYIPNGMYVKKWLDEGYDIYEEVNGEGSIIATPPNTFYGRVYAETALGVKIVATPEEGWIGL